MPRPTPWYAQDVDDEVSRYFRSLGFEITWDFRHENRTRWYEIFVDGELVAQIDFGVPLARLIEDMILWSEDLSVMDPSDYDICVSEEREPQFKKILAAVVKKEKGTQSVQPMGVGHETPTPQEPNAEAEALWRRAEFDRGYKAGYAGEGYSPTSLPYIEGYESGELAAMRAGKRSTDLD